MRVLQAHTRLDTLCTQLENLSTTDSPSTHAIKQSITSAVTDAYRASSAEATDLSDRVSRIEAAAATAAAAPPSTLTPAPKTPAARPQSAATDGEPLGDAGGAIAPSRKVAIQRLVEVAIGDLEARLLERVLERCATADDAVKRCAYMHDLENSACYVRNN